MSMRNRGDLSETPSAVVATPCANVFGWNPIWSPYEQALYWVDMHAPSLHRLKPRSRQHEFWPMPEPCCGVALAPSGVIVALGGWLIHFQPATGELTPLIEVRGASSESRLNALKCDARGRLWAATTRNAAVEGSGSLYRIDADARCSRILSDLRNPSSLGWSPDFQAMYVSDAAEHHVRRYEYANSDGSLGDMTSFRLAGVEADWLHGCAVDAEGCIWSARAQPGKVTRLSPEGDILSAIALSASQVTACAFGGPGLRTLFVTTASQNLPQEERDAQPEAGHLFGIDVLTPGRPETAAAFLQCFPPFLSTGGWPDAALPIY